LTLKVIRDDGCVVYLNGVEVARSNMPSGTITFDTLALDGIPTADENIWHEFSVDPGLFLTGNNVLAVEVHQASVRSSDVSLDLELEGTSVLTPVPMVTLISPDDGATVDSTAVSFTCAATDALGLADATLYVGDGLTTVSLSGPSEVEDTQLTANTPNSNQANAVTIEIDAQGPHAHGLMKFPNLIGAGVGQVPAGTSIVSATLEVNCTNAGDEMQVYRLTEGWVEGEATWNERTAGVLWTDAGADGAGSNGGAAVNGDCTVIGVGSIDLTQFVQAWSDGSPNHGIVLTDGGDNGVDITSSESTTSPVLHVVYGNALQALESQVLSGTSAVAGFTANLADQQNYRWNCLVTNTSSEQDWAPADFVLTVDTLGSP
jgi:hypothetical protein